MKTLESREVYRQRIHKVQDYIEENLQRALTLSELSDVAGFSKYHFHRLFSALTHETLLQYITRIKMERSAFFLIHRPEITVTDIAYHFGFSDSAGYARSFKKHYAVSPTEFRKQYSKKCKANRDETHYTHSIPKKSKGWDTMKVKASKVELLTVESLQVIYLRFTGSYQKLATAMPNMMKKLYDFAASRNLLVPGETKVMTLYHDNPDMTEEDQLRTSLCLSVPNTCKVEVNGEIGLMSLSGKYAVGHFELTRDDFAAAWQYMYGEWLPSSACQPRDALPFEVYVSEPPQTPDGKQLVAIYLPVEPLGQL